LEGTALKLRYRSIDQFAEHCRQLKSGRMFIPTEMPLPAKTRLLLSLILPDAPRRITLEMEVLEAVDRKSGAALKKPCGMLLGPAGELEATLRTLAQEIRATPGLAAALAGRPGTGDSPPAGGTTPPQPPGEAPVPPSPSEAPARSAESAPDAQARPPEDAALPISWIRSAVAQEEAQREIAPEAAVAPVTSVKKDLSAAERERIKPVGEFVMDLTKAMLRTGYYASDHPGSQNAKHGLYEALQRCLRDSSEIMVTHQEARERNEILITGILDEPVNVRTVVGAGMAELFVPKLSECFNRKALVSFALKKVITPEHFEGFVDVMSDPTAERGQHAKVGELLTRSLVDRGITEISTVFMDDIIVLEKNLPWRVEMAIQRLAKDLKVLPMFRGESDEAIKRMKLQIIQDILRPLKHPEFLKDLIINCYVIAQHVKNVKEEDIEEVIIDAFPLDTLLPTSRFIFTELNRLKDISAQDPDNPAVQRRFAGVKRILKWVSRRLVLADVGGAQGFLEELYANGILTFEELPPDVQYLVNTHKMTRNVAAHIRSYVQRLLQPASAGDAAVLLKCFRRAIPPLIEQGDLQTVLALARAVNQAKAGGTLAAGEAGLPADPLLFLFQDRARELQGAYERADESRRTSIEAVLDFLGVFGIETLCRILSESEDRGARKAAMNALSQKGSRAREWVLAVLEDPTQKWFLKRNALMLLRHIGADDRDIEPARKLMAHDQARVRDEALNTIVALKAPDAEKLAFKALDDPDEKVRWRAATALADLSPLSDEIADRLFSRLAAEPPEDKDLAARHYRRVTQIIQTVGGMKSFKDRDRVEAAVLEVAQKAAGHKKGILQRIRKSGDAEDAKVLTAAISALGAMGTARSEPFLAKMAEGRIPQAPAAAKALEAVRTRLAAAPPQG
jgi:HEAT repeat protein